MSKHSRERHLFENDEEALERLRETTKPLENQYRGQQKPRVYRRSDQLGLTPEDDRAA